MASDGIEEVWKDAIIKWVEIDSNSKAVGRSIRDLGIRTHTCVTVVSVQRGAETIADPGADLQMESGDVLVTVGTEESHELFGIGSDGFPLHPQTLTVELNAA